MADANKQQSPWPFGQQSSTPAKPGGIFGQGTSQASSGTSLFGSNTNPSANPGASLFGSGSNPPATSGTGLFGGASAAPAAGSFGSTAGSNQANTSSVFGASGGGGNGNNSVFGGASQNPANPFLLSQNTGKNASQGIFGSSQAPSQGNVGSSTAPGTGFFTPSKPSDSSASEQQKPNPFGGNASTGGSLFPNLGTSTSSAAQASSTPTSKPTTSLFNTSTTPAGPPPSTASGAGSAFNFLKPQSQTGETSSKATPSIFGNTPQPSTALSGSSKPTESPATASTLPTASSNDSASKDNGSIFGTKRAVQPEGGLFNNLNQNKSQETGNAKPNLFMTNASAGKASGTKSLADAPPLGGSSTNPKIGFPSDTGSLPSNSGTSQPFTASNIFTTSKPTASSESATPSTTAATSLFPTQGKAQNNATTSTTSSSSVAAPASTSNLFNTSKAAAPAASSQAPAPDTTKAPAGLGTSAAANNANLGASVTGPAPPAQSRLKNKSMDDIITRWASDLSKYQKEFQSQAEKVAQWDRMLVENSEKIQRLYGSTLEAERATSEVERQLTAVENDQAELELWLDNYEKEVDTMISNQVGQGESISGPDQERERTYQLAAQLSEKLDEMGKDLGTMIEEINDASSKLNKTSKADDPLSQVVRVLNGHLTQLQQIDQGAAALTLKVKEAQKAGQMVGPPSGLSGPSSDAADGFYRSYMGRR